MPLSFITDVILEQVDSSIALDVPHTVVTAVAQSSSSIGSVPPGFTKHLEPICTASASAPLLEANCYMVLLENQDNEMTSTEVPPVPLEEGEFTSVITKRIKKLLKKSEKIKVKVKPGNRANSTSRAFLMKGAKHKFF